MAERMDGSGVSSPSRCQTAPKRNRPLLMSQGRLAWALGVGLSVFYGADCRADELPPKLSDQISEYQKEAMKLPPQEIYDQVMDGIRQGRIEYESDHKLLNLRAHAEKGTGYSAALNELYLAGNADAALYSALLDKLICTATSDPGFNPDQGAIKNCFLGVLSKLRFSADAHNPVAMRQISEFYEKGYGMQRSKLVAVDWLLKAAKAEIDKTNYAQAFDDVEKASALIPDHPKALKMRALLLNAER
ncbi:MAG: hypothetical protein V4637_02560 [Pseudomonadota bacterium]